MKYAILGLAIGTSAFVAIVGSVAGVMAQEPDADYSGIGDFVDFSGLDGLENLAPPPVEEPVVQEPPAATVEQPAPAVIVVAPAPVAPVAAGGVVALPATGDGGKDGATSSAPLLLYAATVAVMGTLIVVAAKRRA